MPDFIVNCSKVHSCPPNIDVNAAEFFEFSQSKPVSHSRDVVCYYEQSLVPVIRHIVVAGQKTKRLLVQRQELVRFMASFIPIVICIDEKLEKVSNYEKTSEIFLGFLYVNFISI